MMSNHIVELVTHVWNRKLPTPIVAAKTMSNQEPSVITARRLARFHAANAASTNEAFVSALIGSAQNSGLHSRSVFLHRR